MFSSVRTQLVLLFFAITAAAIGFIFVYVVPQLRSSLTAEKLRRLEAVAGEQRRLFDHAIATQPSQRELRRLLLRARQRADARVTLLGVRDGQTGPEPAFVVADSDAERSAVAPAYPAAAAATESGSLATGVERLAGERVGETAVPVPSDGPPRWVAVLSTPLGDVEDNVALIQRQILIAGVIALAAALAAGWLAARAHSRRLRRLEDAAEKVAHGDFATPIPVDSADEVGQLAATLNEMRERLERLDRARKEFIANASHELRTPIFSLGGFVELLDEEDPDPEARAEFVRTMREQIGRLTKLAADLLDLSKLDADALSLRTEAVDLGALVERIAAEFGPAAEAHSSRLVVERGAPARVAADPDRVEQILRILIDNALAHTPPGTEVVVRVARDGGRPVLVVSDDGPGIPADSREQVFERFFTGDHARGSGLGLAIARELARLMEGEVELALRDGRTEFVVSLPATRQSAAPA